MGGVGWLIVPFNTLRKLVSSSQLSYKYTKLNKSYWSYIFLKFRVYTCLNIICTIVYHTADTAGTCITAGNLLYFLYRVHLEVLHPYHRGKWQVGSFCTYKWTLTENSQSRLMAMFTLTEQTLSLQRKKKQKTYFFLAYSIQHTNWDLKPLYIDCVCSRGRWHSVYHEEDRGIRFRSK